MTTTDVKFARVKNGLPYYAQVSLGVERDAKSPAIVFSCSGDGFRSQGYLEEVSVIGYDDWKAGARVGVSFALALAQEADCSVDISRIEGLSTDTNPTIVGYAAALAVWKALGFEPTSEVVARLEKIIFSSWKRPNNEIPIFT